MGKLQRLEERLGVYEAGIDRFKQYLESSKFLQFEEPSARVRISTISLRFRMDIELPIKELDALRPCVFAGYTHEELLEAWLAMVYILAREGKVTVPMPADKTLFLAATHYFCERTFIIHHHEDRNYTMIGISDEDFWKNIEAL